MDPASASTDGNVSSIDRALRGINVGQLVITALENRWQEEAMAPMGSSAQSDDHSMVQLPSYISNHILLEAPLQISTGSDHDGITRDMQQPPPKKSFIAVFKTWRHSLVFRKDVASRGWSAAKSSRLVRSVLRQIIDLDTRQIIDLDTIAADEAINNMGGKLASQLCFTYCHYVPKRRFQIPASEMRLSREAIDQACQVTDSLLNTDNCTASQFLEAYHSHVSTGPYDVGGIFFHEVSIVISGEAYRSIEELFQVALHEFRGYPGVSAGASRESEHDYELPASTNSPAATISSTTAQEVQVRNLTSCLGSGSLQARDVPEFLSNLDNNPSLWAIIDQPKFDEAIDGLESVWQIIVRQLPGLNAPPDKQAKAWRLEQAAILISRQWEEDITRLARVKPSALVGHPLIRRVRQANAKFRLLVEYEGRRNIKEAIVQELIEIERERVFKGGLDRDVQQQLNRAEDHAMRDSADQEPRLRVFFDHALCSMLVSVELERILEAQLQELLADEIVARKAANLQALHDPDAMAACLDAHLLILIREGMAGELVKHVSSGSKHVRFVADALIAHKCAGLRREREWQDFFGELEQCLRIAAAPAAALAAPSTSTAPPCVLLAFLQELARRLREAGHEHPRLTPIAESVSSLCPVVASYRAQYCATAPDAVQLHPDDVRLIFNELLPLRLLEFRPQQTYGAELQRSVASADSIGRDAGGARISSMRTRMIRRLVQEKAMIEKRRMQKLAGHAIESSSVCELECPMCRRTCMQGLAGHKGLHDTVHQPVGLGAVHDVDTMGLVPGSCSKRLHLDRHVKRRDDTTFPYRDFHMEFQGWCNPGSCLTNSRYLDTSVREYVFFNYQKQLVAHFNHQRPHKTRVPCLSAKMPRTYNHGFRPMWEAIQNRFDQLDCNFEEMETALMAVHNIGITHTHR